MKRENDYTPDMDRMMNLLRLYLKLSEEFIKLNAEGQEAGKKWWHPTQMHDEGLDLATKILGVEDSRRATMDPMLIEAVHDKVLVSALSVIVDMLDVQCYIALKAEKSVEDVISNISPILKEMNNAAYNPYPLASIAIQCWTHAENEVSRG